MPPPHHQSHSRDFCFSTRRAEGVAAFFPSTSLVIKTIQRWFGSAAQLMGAGPPRDPGWSKASKLFLRDHRDCVVCGGPATVVHHCKPFHLFPELEMDPDNWRSVCEGSVMNCHLCIGHSGDFKAWNPQFDVDSAILLKRLKERHYTRS